MSVNNEIKIEIKMKIKYLLIKPKVNNNWKIKKC